MDRSSFRGPGICKEGKKEEKEMGSKEGSCVPSKSQVTQRVRKEKPSAEKAAGEAARGEGCSGQR